MTRKEPKPKKVVSSVAAIVLRQEDLGTLIISKTDQAGRPIGPSVIEFLRQSEIFKEYQQAFCETTGLPLTLIETKPKPFPSTGQPKENPLRALAAQTEPGCASWLDVQKELSSKIGEMPVTLKCFAGLSDTAIPVRAGDKILGYLHTGEIFLSEPTRKVFKHTVKLLLEWGMKTDVKRLESVYFGTRVLTPQQYDSMLRLLSVFAKHLSEISNRLVIEPKKLLPPMIKEAKRYIQQHHQEPLSLTEVAKRVNVSAQYFSSLFHKATGITFTDYVARVRVEQAKILLADPRNRISEVAFVIGFESLSQFNRVFRRLVGHAPTQFRAQRAESKS